MSHSTRNTLVAPGGYGLDIPDEVTLEAAIAIGQNVEDALLETANKGDKDILQFQSLHNLCNDRALWAYQTCCRLRFKNKKYRGQTKQALVDQAQELKTLHTELGMHLDAYRNITALVDVALTECRAAYSYYHQCQQLHGLHSEGGAAFPQRREMTRRSLMRAQKTTTQLRDQEQIIRSTYAAWKPCIALLSSRRQLRRSLKQLHARKLSKADFEQDCNTVLDKLLSIVAHRNDVRNKIGFAGAIQTVMWCSLPADDTISQSQIANALRGYNGLEKDLLDTYSAQCAVLQAIEDMYERAEATPHTLPGIDGAEIPVERLLATLTEYESLAAQCRETYTLAKSTADDLRSVLSVTPGI